MYWLLLPLDANAHRHLGDAARPPKGLWTRMWAGLLSRSIRSPERTNTRRLGISHASRQTLELTAESRPQHVNIAASKPLMTR